MSQRKTKQILASMLMGLNILNMALCAPAEASFPETVGSGETVDGSVVVKDTGMPNSGSIQTVENGGKTTNTNISNGGTQVVKGTDVSATVGNKGVQKIENGGVASGTTVSNGGKQTVSNGGNVSNYKAIMAGGVVTVETGGTVTQSVSMQDIGGQMTIAAGGTHIIKGTNGTGTGIYVGGRGSFLTVQGKQYVSSGGNLNGAIFVNGGGEQIISDKGHAGNVRVQNQGTQTVLKGGSADSTNVYAGGTQLVDGGTVTIYTIQAGGTQIVRNSGYAYYTNPRPNSVFGTQIVSDGGSVNDVQIAGTQYVGEGGTTYRSIILNGGTQHVLESGYAVWNDVRKGCEQLVEGGTAISNTISGGAAQTVSGGTATSNMLRSGATQTVSGGTAISNMISGGASQTVEGGTTISTMVSSGAAQTVNGGEAVSNMISTGATQTINGGKATFNDIASGATQTVNDGEAVSNTISSGASQTVNGGTVTSNDIASGGTQTVLGGTAVSNIVSTGATHILSSGGTTIHTSIASGVTQLVVAGAVTMDNIISAGGSQIITGGLADGNSIASGVTQILSGGTSKDTVLEDGANVSAYEGTVNGVDFGGSSVVAVFTDSIKLSNFNMSGGSVYLGADGGDYNIGGTFNFDGGVLDMVSNPDLSLPNKRTYETLTIENLTGNAGTFKLDTDLNSAVYGSETTYGDKIVINGGTNGKHYLQVADASLYSGTEITGERKLLVVTDNSGVQDLEVIGKDLNNGGVWFTHAPTLFKEGDEWYLGYIQKEATNDTTVMLTNHQTVYNQWTRINNDTLRKRLGDLRYNESDAGVWTRFYSGKLSGSGYEQSYQHYQVGLDKKLGNTYVGIAMDKQNSNQTYDYGTGEGSSLNGTLYATHYTDTGTYLDTVLKYGNVNSEYYTNGDFPDHADYDTKAYSVSLEYGKTNRLKKGFFIEPKIQATYGYLSSGKYSTDRGTTIHEDGIKSFIGRAGIVLGRKMQDADYHFTASWLKEFRGDRFIHMAAANGENMYVNEDYGDTWFELGLGGNVKIARKTHLYGEIEKSFGATINKKWQINAGARFEF